MSSGTAHAGFTISLRMGEARLGVGRQGRWSEGYCMTYNHVLARDD